MTTGEQNRLDVLKALLNTDEQFTSKDTNLFLKVAGLISAYSGKTIEGRFFDCSVGWDKLICTLIYKILCLGWDGRVTQIKEKYGTLRFYIGAATDEVHSLISAYERLSAETCEICGDTETAKIRGMNWYATYCDKHSMEHYGQLTFEEEEE